MLTKDHWVKEQAPQNKTKMVLLSTCSYVSQIFFEVDSLNTEFTESSVALTVCCLQDKCMKLHQMSLEL